MRQPPYPCPSSHAIPPAPLQHPDLPTPRDARATLVDVRATLVLAGPIVVSQLAQVSNGLVDTIMVGRLGPTALAGVALGSSVFFTTALVCLGVVLAVGPMVSQAAGAGDREGVARSARQGLWMALVLALPAGALLQFAAPLLALTRQDPRVLAIAGGYLGAVAWGIGPFLGFGVLRSFAEGLEKPTPVTLIALSAVAVNVFANDTFIYGRYGVPAMGAVGVGWATATSYWYLFAALALFTQARPLFRRYGVFRHLSRPDPAFFRELFRVGWPIGISFGIEAGLFTATAVMAGALGGTALAAHQIAIQCASFTFMVPLSVGLAGSVRVGQAVGGGRGHEARRAGLTAIGLALVFMCGAALAFLTVPRPLIGLFLDGDRGANRPVVELAVGLLGIAGAFQVFDGIQAAAAGALRGLKDTRVPMLIGLAAYWGVGLTAAYALGFGAGLGARGLWMGLVLGLATAAAGLTWRFHRRSLHLEAVYVERTA